MGAGWLVLVGVRRLFVLFGFVVFRLIVLVTCVICVRFCCLVFCCVLLFIDVLVYLVACWLFVS